jgi:hypothetical protein
MAWYLVFWRNRSTSTVVPAASASQARSRATCQRKRGYGAIVATRPAKDDNTRLIFRGQVATPTRRLQPRVRLGSIKGAIPVALQPV